MGFGHRVYRAEDPRARVLRRTARELGSPRFEVAEALERAALAELKARKPDRVLATNVEFWSAVVLDTAEVPRRAVHADVHLRARGRLVGAHPRAEARGPADPSDGEVRRPRAAAPERPHGRAARGDCVAATRLVWRPNGAGAPAGPRGPAEITWIACTARRGRCAGRARTPRTSCRTRSTRVLARPRIVRGDDDLGYLLRVLRNTFISTRRTAGRRPIAAGIAPEELELPDPRRATQPEVAAGDARGLRDHRRPARATSATRSPRSTSWDSRTPRPRRALRVREGTVTSRLYRARAQVAKALGERS